MNTDFGDRYTLFPELLVGLRAKQAGVEAKRSHEPLSFDSLLYSQAKIVKSLLRLTISSYSRRNDLSPSP